jgi:hypothetical protein
MSTRKLVPKHNAIRICGQHRCNHCGKDLPTAAGLKCHIASSKTLGCRDQWEREVLRREPTKSPSPPATDNDAVSPQYVSPVPEFPPEELPAFIPPKRLGHLASNSEPDQSTPEPPSKRARVEEADDEEAGGCHRWAQEFEGAAEELGEGKTLFEEIRESQEAMCEPPMAPFLDEEEWDLARWLMKNVTQMATEEFLKMKGVRHNFDSD